MDTNLFKIFEAHGTTGLIVVAFFYILYNANKRNELREDKLYKVIEELAKTMPTIQEDIKNIEKKIDALGGKSERK